jgi:hypothetical protein
VRAHYSCGDVGVCGVYDRVSEISP